MTERLSTPDKEQIALLEPFERLSLGQIQVIATAQHAARALQELHGIAALGFDTESNPLCQERGIARSAHRAALTLTPRLYLSARRR